MTATETGQALLRAILDSPDDDLPRLAYADWLDEHARTWPCNFCDGSGLATLHGPDRHDMDCGQCVRGVASDGRAERAAFIRAQLANDPKAWASKLWPDSLVRLTDEGDGREPPERGWQKWEWSRGFVSEVTTTLGQWLRHGPAVAAAHPVGLAWLTGRAPSGFAELYGGRFWAWRVEDDLVGCGAGAHVVPAGIYSALADERPEWFLAGSNRWKRYDSEPAAREALAIAAARWARSAAR